ncbi:MAG: trimethylamine methyltransferase family protein [Spirochaetota bacterium]
MPKSMFLTKAKAKKIHEASCNILEKTGFKLNHEEAEDLLLSAGAKKDSEERILIPHSMVEEALAKVNKKIQFYDREGKKAILVKPGRTYFGPGSDALYNIDRETGELRFSALHDVSDNVKIADYLKGYDFVMSMALPNDVDTHKLYTSIFVEMLKNTTKPIVTTATTVDDIKQIHKIASIVAGGDNILREKPFFIAYLEPNSPLIADWFSTERLLYCAENQIPFLYAAGANIGASAPITLTGAVAQGNAESLFGLVLATLKNENVRFIHGSNSSSVDMMYGKVLYGAPEWFKTVAMYADMGRYYQIPTWGTGGCSDSHCIDAQAGLEAYEGILLSVQSGPTLVHDVGYLSYGFLYDVRMLVLTDEIIRRARHLNTVIKVTESDEEESTKAIDDVARGWYGSFLDHPQTAAHFRKQLWLPPRFIRRKLLGAGDSSTELYDKLSEEVSKILANHTPRKLSRHKLEQIESYMQNL